MCLIENSLYLKNNFIKIKNIKVKKEKKHYMLFEKF
jgi:hypothetical protein